MLRVLSAYVCYEDTRCVSIKQLNSDLSCQIRTYVCYLMYSKYILKYIQEHIKGYLPRLLSDKL